MREDCCHYESRTYDDGEVARLCTLDLAPEAPWRYPEVVADIDREHLMVATDGGIFSFSDQPFAGSLGANPPARSIVAVAATG
jgi:hypothetical protein